MHDTELALFCAKHRMQGTTYKKNFDKVQNGMWTYKRYTVAKIVGGTLTVGTFEIARATVAYLTILVTMCYVTKVDVTAIINPVGHIEFV